MTAYIPRSRYDAARPLALVAVRWMLRTFSSLSAYFLCSGPVDQDSGTSGERIAVDIITTEPSSSFPWLWGDQSPQYPVGWSMEQYTMNVPFH